MAAMMAEAAFWKIIDDSRTKARALPRKPAQDFMDLHERTLADALRQLRPADVAAFAERFEHYRRLAYRWDLWGAAYWLHGGCGDDSFLDFRACLVSLGRERFEKVLKNPDSLADLVDLPDMPYMLAEGFQYVPGQVYEELTGQELPYEGAPGETDEPAGKKFDFDDEDEMARRYPKLVAKFPEMGD